MRDRSLGGGGDAYRHGRAWEGRGMGAGVLNIGMGGCVRTSEDTGLWA